ncbi:alpha/beta fold hydrolase [Lichenifustis flavocetrariae]|uniref:Alpha/beta hydrolase n=1 Tax=Lichenifustis flavocetrariae TaxID=2949735 RepID=A0AA41YTG0_9HYPH|nr:alpha/beta fold hydrolase [Lichenifustis flavocetrariae]MCW6507005.1 alpha/beta hydrolase [Lichenifustis flavocetrariae]
MSGIVFERDDAVLRGYDRGEGAPLLFQHGLGGSEMQVAENVPDLAGTRRLTLDCRAQGSSTAGTTRPFSIGLFAADALAFCDARGVESFAVGGISMGAAIALHLAVRHPNRVRALILARPAWLFDPGPENMRPYAAVAHALRHAPPAEAKAAFIRSDTAAMLAKEAPDNLASLLGFFDRPDPEPTADLLGAIAADGPGVSRAEARALKLPTLVIGHGVDHAHPLATAKILAETIPNARLVEIPPKATDKAAHIVAFRAAVTRFLHDLAMPTEFRS